MVPAHAINTSKTKVYAEPTQFAADRGLRNAHCSIERRFC
jgi:hypothetical protein